MLCCLSNIPIKSSWKTDQEQVILVMLHALAITKGQVYTYRMIFIFIFYLFFIFFINKNSRALTPSGMHVQFYIQP
jgi:Ca2+/Na+ antiporter